VTEATPVQSSENVIEVLARVKVSHAVAIAVGTMVKKKKRAQRGTWLSGVAGDIG
jgi:hypothetical protein